MTVERSDQSERDLLDVWLFIAGDSIEAADRFLDRLDESIQLLSRNPLMGRARDEIAPGCAVSP